MAQVTKSFDEKLKFTTGKVRLVYVYIFEPKVWGERDKPKYQVTALIPKDDKETLTAVANAIQRAKEIGGTATMLPLKDGDTKAKEIREKAEAEGSEVNEKLLEAYKGHFILKLSSEYKPGVYDALRNEVTDPSEFYSGVYGAVIGYCKHYTTPVTDGVTVYLKAVQKIEDGEVLVTSTNVADDFKVWGNVPTQASAPAPAPAGEPAAPALKGSESPLDIFKGLN
jgi:hypothetical protein